MNRSLLLIKPFHLEDCPQFPTRDHLIETVEYELWLRNLNVTATIDKILSESEIRLFYPDRKEQMSVLIPYLQSGNIKAYSIEGVGDVVERGRYIVHHIRNMMTTQKEGDFFKNLIHGSDTSIAADIEARILGLV